MKQRQTMIGLAAVLALAVTLFAGVSAASAAVFKGEAENTSISGEETGTTGLSLEGEGFTCPGNISFGTTLPGVQGSTLTTSAWAPGCVFLGESAKWNVPSGCQYRFRAGFHESMQGTMDIVGCSAPMSYSRFACHVEIPNQEGLGPVTYVNEGTGSSRRFRLVVQIKNLTFTRTGGGACFGPPGTFHNGEYHGEWTAKGSIGKTQTGVWLESEPATDFAVEEAPATLSGELEAGSRTGFVFPGGAAQAECTKEGLAGTVGATKVKTLTVTPSYSSCKLNGASGATVESGGCSFTYHIDRTVDIGGATCASKPITIKHATSCTITIGPQTGLSGLKFEQWGADLLITGRASGLSYTETGAWCLAQGSFSDGYIGLAAEGTNLEYLGATNSLGVAQRLWLY